MPTSAMALDTGLDWSACGATLQPGPVPASPTGLTRIEADSAIFQRPQETATFTGNVHMQFQDKQVYAQDLRYDRNRDEVSTQGEVLLYAPDIRVRGRQLYYQPESATGTLEDVKYRLFNPAARGTADRAQMLGRGLSSYQNIRFTTCPPGNDDFTLAAKQLRVDRNQALGTFEAATFRFLGIPVFYAPKLTIPLDDRRKSGFLLPSVGYRSRTGIDIATPYYFNLAENYDATFTPRYLSKRGLALGGEFRYLKKPHQGQLRAEILPDDREYEPARTRGAFYWRHKSILAPDLTGELLVNAVSDKQYLRDLGSSLAVSGSRFLPSSARLEFHNRYWDFLGRLQYFQTVDDRIADSDKPYARLPQVRADMIDARGPGGLYYSLLSEYVHFYRDTGVTAHRAYVNPGIAMPVRRDWGYLEPKLTANYTVYSLNGQAPGIDDRLDRSIGSASLDAGLFFDRRTRLFGERVTHTLEPRLFYLYVPEVDQNDIPVFDTGLLDFNFDNLFRLNRYNGLDRIGDANRITLALSSRILSGRTGGEIFKASIGQIYHFSGRNVTLPTELPQHNASSPIYAQIKGRLPAYWQYRAGTEIDLQRSSGKVLQGLAQLIYRSDDEHFFAASYRQRRDIVEQTDLSLLWPLTEDISVIGRWNYSLLKNKTLESIAGLEYGRCCWRIRTVLRQYLANDSDDQNVTFMIQLELKGLGILGNDIQSFLYNNLYGYRNDSY